MMSTSDQSKKCCFKEKERLMEVLQKCEYCADSYEVFQQCYSDAAKESGQRARDCIAA